MDTPHVQSTKPCCRSLEVTFQCGHTDSKYVQYTVNGKRIRSDSDPLIKPCPTTFFASENTMNMPDSLNQSAIHDKAFGRLSLDDEVKVGDANIPETTSDHDIYRAHEHPLCGLFFVTYEKPDLYCPACSRRNHSAPSKIIIHRLQAKLRVAKKCRWSRETICHIKKRLQEACRDRDEVMEIVDAIEPLFGDEDWIEARDKSD